MRVTSAPTKCENKTKKTAENNQLMKENSIRPFVYCKNLSILRKKVQKMFLWFKINDRKKNNPILQIRRPTLREIIYVYCF